MVASPKQNYRFEPVPDDLVLRQVHKSMAASGVVPLDGLDSFVPVRDGKVHRFDVEGDKRGDKTGAYKLYPNEPPAGWFQNHRETGVISWCFDYSELKEDAAYRAAYEQAQTPEFKSAMKAKQKEREKLETEERARASDEARGYFASCTPAPEDHSYLVKKQVAKYGDLREVNGELLIPLHDGQGRFMTFQRIAPDGGKRFREGCPVKGGRFTIAGDITEGPILIAEGYATAASAYEATGLMTVAAISAHNLLPVAQSLRRAYPGRKVIILADDDAKTAQKTSKNPGIAAAFECVKAKAADDVIAPPFDRAPDKDGLAPSDWNDYAAHYGIDATEKTLREAIAWACMTEKERKEHDAREKVTDMRLSLDKTVQLPPIDLVGGMFPKKALSAVIAAPGVGKTWFLQRLISDISMGGPVFDGFAVERSPRKCLIFAGEAGYDTLIRRATETRWNVNEDNIDIFDMIRCAREEVSFDLDDKDGKRNVEMAIDIFRPDIVFFDTLSAFHSSDENKAKEMTPIMKYLLKLAGDWNIAIVIMHHTRKRKPKEQTLRMTQDEAIGSSILNRMAGLIVGIEEIDGEGNDDAMGQNKPKLVSVQKSWLPKFPPFTFRVTEDDDERTVMKIDLDPKLPGGIRPQIWAFIEGTYAPGGWFKASDVVQGLGGVVTTRHVRRCLTAWCDSKKLLHRGENKGSEYAIPGFYKRG